MKREEIVVAILIVAAIAADVTGWPGLFAWALAAGAAGWAACHLFMAVRRVRRRGRRPASGWWV